MAIIGLLTMMSASVSAAEHGCPTNFNYDRDKHICTAERPHHGTCPEGSEYKLDLNRCVWKK